MKLTIQEILGLTFIVVILTMVGLVIHHYIVKESECLAEYTVIDPSLVLLVFVAELDRENVLSERDKYQALQGVTSSSWVYNDGELEFRAMLNNRNFSAEVCYTTTLDEEGVPQPGTEFRNLVEYELDN